MSTGTVNRVILVEWAGSTPKAFLNTRSAAAAVARRRPTRVASLTDGTVWPRDYTRQVSDAIDRHVSEHREGNPEWVSELEDPRSFSGALWRHTQCADEVKRILDGRPARDRACEGSGVRLPHPRFVTDLGKPVSCPRCGARVRPRADGSVPVHKPKGSGS